MAKNDKDEKKESRLIATNPRARSDFFIDDVLEAGLVLRGTEIKSIRVQSPNIKDAFVEVKQKNGKLEAWLVNAHVAPYSHGNLLNHEPLRPRKLLLHRRELNRLFGAVTQKGLSIIPLRMYFKKGFAKLEIGCGKGKKKYDKREDQKARSAQKEMSKALKRGQIR